MTNTLRKPNLFPNVKKLPTRRKTLGVLSRLKSRFTKSNTKSKKTTSRKTTILKRKYSKTMLTVLIFLFLFAFIIFFISNGIQLVAELRGHNEAATDEISKEDVEGFDGVPIFPRSEFVYKEYEDREGVKEFLESGQSVYRLPPNTSFDDAIEYYKEALPKVGKWEHVLSVPLGADSKKSGEYWVREQLGIRIYTRLGDIWYQKISVEQAKDGLAEEVRLEQERDLILSANDGTDLLPNYPWGLRVPSEYLVRYFDSDYVKDAKSVSFKKLNSSEMVFLYVIGREGSTDAQLQERVKEIVKIYNDNLLIELRTNSTDPKAAELPFTTELSEQGLKESSAKIRFNNKDKNFYLVISNSDVTPLVEYIYTNLQEKRTGLTNQDLSLD